MSKVILSSLALAFAAKLWGDHLQALRQYRVPQQLAGHPVHFEENLVPEAVAEEMRNHLKEIGVLYTNAADTQWYDPIYEDVGEAQPFDNGCSDPFLVPNKNRTKCVLPGRTDVGRHFILTGGPMGLKEIYDNIVSRLLSFGIYNWDLSKDPSMESLFLGEKFQNAAKLTCPKDKQFIHPFQGNYIVQIPGQTVAAHIDAPYFWGANRFQFPQWLLAVMTFSGLFEDQFIPQVQVVGYIHEWDPRSIESNKLGGKFIFWGAEGKNTPKDVRDHRMLVHADTVLPVPLAGVSVDGSRLVHAADVYYPDITPPKIDKSKACELKYNAAKDNWDLKIDEKVVQSYENNDLRISIVFRARCHKDEAEAKRFQEQMYDNSMAMKMEDILSVLVNDMSKCGIINKMP